MTDAGGSATSRPAVFLSYSRGDQATARQVIALLEGAGLTVWWDALLEGGVNYLPETQAALESAACIVVLWSKISVESYWVRDEAQEGRERDCLVPLSIDGSLPPLGFRQFQVIDASRWNGDPASEEGERIRRAVLAKCGCADEPAPVRTTTAPPRSGAIDRRTAIGLGAGAGILALGGAAWFGGLFSKQGGSNSIAVIPFRNVSSNPEEKFFSDGLSNELRVALVRNPHLRVAAPASSESLAEDGEKALSVAKSLGMANLLRGSVQRSGDMVRVAAELVGTGDAVVRWAQSFDRKLEDVFAVQSDIAGQVALALVTEVAGADEAQASLEAQDSVGGTDSIEAYEAYLRGRSLYDLSGGPDSDRAALAQFEKAIALDPAYAAAHAMRATMLSAVATAQTEPSATARLFDQAIEAAKRAITLAPELTTGHLALGYALNNGKLDPRAARSHYAEARALAGGDADALRSIASFLAFDGEGVQATELIARALSLDPLNARAFRSASNVKYAARDYRGAIIDGDRALELNAEMSIVPFVKASAQIMLGSYDAALATAAKEPVALFRHVAEAIAHSRKGSAAAAQGSFDALVSEYGDGALYQQAQVLAQMGETARALGKLADAGRARDPGMLLARTDPFLDPLRKAPEFSRLLGVVRA